MRSSPSRFAAAILAGALAPSLGCGPASSAGGPATVLAASDTALVRGAVGARLHRLLLRYHEYGYSGAVLVAVRDTVVLRQAYGLADRDDSVPNTPATPFDVASITKTLTGAAILRLADRGLLSPDDRLERFFGPFPPAKAPATVEHLATHRAGLAARGTPVAAASRSMFVQRMRDAPIESPPGERYRYTNAGSSLLAAVVEVVSGEAFETFVARELLQPAGIASTGFRDAPPGDRAVGYVGGPTTLDTVPLGYQWGDRGADGWVTTVSDLYRWFRALYGGAVLRPETTARLFAPKAEEAYGWHSDATSRWGGAAIHKGGDVESYTSQIVYLPTQRIFLAWTSNSHRQRWRTQLNDGLLHAAEAPGVDPPPAVTPLPPDRLAAYAGDYASPGGTVRICVGDGGLFAAANEAGVMPGVLFRPTGPDRFTALHPDEPATVDLRFGIAGGRTRLTYGGPERAVSATRVRSGPAPGPCEDPRGDSPR